jgi:hypothetical protein
MELDLLVGFHGTLRIGSQLQGRLVLAEAEIGHREKTARNLVGRKPTTPNGTAEGFVMPARVQVSQAFLVQLVGLIGHRQDKTQVALAAPAFVRHDLRRAACRAAKGVVPCGVSVHASSR